jgi:hypothetical protein
MAKLRMENETLEVQCKELCDSIKDIKAKNINLTTSQLTKHIDLIAQSLTTCPTISGEQSVPSCVSKSQMNPNLSKPSILGKPVFKTVGNHYTIRQLNAFISERLKFLKARFVSQVDEKRVLIKSVNSKLKTHNQLVNTQVKVQYQKSNGHKPEMPLRHRPRKSDNRTIHHKSVTMREIPYKLRSSCISVPTGRIFMMNGNKWSHVCTKDTKVSKGLHNSFKKVLVWQPKTLISPTVGDMSTLN